MELNSKLEKEFRLVELQKKALNKMGIFTVEDLLYYFPVRYGDTSEIKNIESLQKGEDATIFGKISGLKMSKAWVKKIPMGEATLQDDTGKIKIVWFHQPYIAKMIHDGQLVRVEGRVSKKRTKIQSSSEGELYLTNPKIEVVSDIPILSNSDNHSLYPVYPESRGVTSNWLYHAIQKILTRVILTR